MRDIFVTIINHRTPLLLKKCLFSILKNHPELESDILVIDNNSGDNTAEMMRREYPRIRLLEAHHNPGYARAVNWGINNAHHRYILVLNPDIEILERGLDNMVDYMDKHTDIAALGPQLLGPDGKVQASCQRFVTPLFVAYRRTFLGKMPWARKTVDHVLMNDWDHRTPRDVEWLQGSAMLVRRKAIEDIGLMDERFWMYLEDVDWCRRFWQKGWRVHYYPEVKFMHHHLRQSHGSVMSLLTNKLARAHLISGIKYFAKYWGMTRNLRPKFLIEQQYGTPAKKG